MSKVLKTLVLVLCVICFSCGEEVLPKPKGMLRLLYPFPKYEMVVEDCKYSFEKNKIADLQSARVRKKCWFNIEYPTLHATLYLSYFDVGNNLDSLLRDAQNLALEHTVKADGIAGNDYVNKENNVYGRFYEISGNAASQSQFYVTDSVSHFVTGSIYFKVKPNYDSILPAASYLRNDIRHLMETITWSN